MSQPLDVLLNDDLELFSFDVAKDRDFPNLWAHLRAGVFVTMYFDRPFISDHVWCCMSNGEYDGVRTVVENATESLRICRSVDSRRSRAPKPRYQELTILARRVNWQPVNDLEQDLLRSQNYAINVTYVTSGQSAIYLPSVWNERPEWSSTEVIRSLTEKALGNLQLDTTTNTWRDNIVVHKIPVYEIDPSGVGRDHDFLAMEFKQSILESSLLFYRKNLRPNTSPSGLPRLVYLITDNGRRFYDTDERGVGPPPLVRTISDLHGFWNLTYDPQLRKILPLIAMEWLSEALTENNDDDSDYYYPAGAMAALVVFLLDCECYLTLCDDIVLDLIERQGNRDLFDASDPAFVSPQVALALSEYTQRRKHYPHVFKAITKTLRYYDHNVRSIVNTHGTFAANWIGQFVASMSALTRVQRTTVDVLASKMAETIRSQPWPSITELACAIEGYMKMHRAGLTPTIEHSTIVRVLVVLKRYQVEWKHGGFRYYPDQSWYRTDVTTHVVNAIIEIEN